VSGLAGPLLTPLAGFRSSASNPSIASTNLPNKLLTAEYQTVLPDENLIADELERSRRELEKRPHARTISF
jgi:hypothetical protein